MTREPDPRPDDAEEGGPDPTEDPILYLAERLAEWREEEG